MNFKNISYFFEDIGYSEHGEELELLSAKINLKTSDMFKKLSMTSRSCF